MKAFITLSVFSLLSLPAFAADLKGTLEGSCTIQTATSTKTLPFKLANNQKAITNLNDALMIEVVNNLDSGLEEYNGAAVISVSRKNASFSNPPALCPSAPLAEKTACEEENARNARKPVQAPNDSFKLVDNSGFVDSIWIEFNNQESGPISFVFAKVVLSAAKIADGSTLSFPTYDFGGSVVSCSSVFTEN